MTDAPQAAPADFEDFFATTSAPETNVETVEKDADEIAASSVDVESDTEQAGDDLADGTPASLSAVAKARKEAKRVRDSLRAVEGQRDALQRQVVESLIDKESIKSAAFWASGVTLESLVDESGAIDAVRVQSAVVEAKEAFGIQKRFFGDIAQGARALPEDIQPETFAGFLKDSLESSRGK